MKLYTCVFIVLTFSYVVSASEPRKPDYPLYVCSVERNVPYTDDELQKIATWFVHINTGLSADQVDRLKELNPDITVLGYVNSSYANGSSDLFILESEYRDAISMYWTATLPATLDATTRSFSLLPVEDTRLSLKASTTAGSVSDRENSTKKFVTWIQIDNEYMRIDEWDTISRRITVTRGFDGTKAVSHAAGSPVLSPVYIGVKGHTWSGYYPGGFQPHLRYALRIDDPAMHLFKSLPVIKDIRENHLDGVWLDIMSFTFFNQSNMHGEQVRPWNFVAKAPYTQEAYRDNQQRKAEGMRKIIEGELNRRVILTANNFSSKYFPEDGNGLRLLQSTDVQPTPLDGLIMEGFGGEFLHEEFRTGNLMLTNIRQVIEMEARGHAGFCAYDNNASRRAKTPEEAEEKQQYEEYAYAGFLLGVEPGGTTKFGIAAYRRPSPANPEPHLWLHPQYFYGIGKPMESISSDNIEPYRLSGSDTYFREFENAFVFINVSADRTDSFKLTEITKIGKALYDPAQGTEVTSLNMPPHTGRILLKRKEP